MEKKKKSPMSKKKKRILIISISLVLLALTSLLAVAGIAVSGNAIFPNVRVDGIPVGGLTAAQAAGRLESTAALLAFGQVTVELPDDDTMVITAEDAGLDNVSGRDLAEIAHAFGRDGNFFGNVFRYIRSQVSRTNLPSYTLALPDREQIYPLVTARAQEFTAQQLQASYELLEESIIITTSRVGLVFDKAALTELIYDAFLSGYAVSDTPVVYNAEQTTAIPTDVLAIYNSIAQTMQNAAYDIETDTILEHTIGIRFDVELARQRVRTAPPGTEIEVPLIIIMPDITAEYLREALFRDELARSTTSLVGSSAYRVTNVRLAAEAVNGVILNPGEQFDYNTVVGQRTAARGFQPAPVFFGTEVRTAVGGGICQVSSGIFHALLHTELQVDRRSNHTLTVGYLPLGMDAAVAWGGPEFSFTNTSDFPLKITGEIIDRNLVITLVGTNQSLYDQIRPESVVVSHTPFRTEYQDDPSLPLGERRTEQAGIRGQVVDTFQRFYDENGTLVRREHAARSTYQPVTEIIRIGTGEVIDDDPIIIDPDPPIDTQPPHDPEDDLPSV